MRCELPGTLPKARIACYFRLAMDHFPKSEATGHPPALQGVEQVLRPSNSLISLACLLNGFYSPFVRFIGKTV